MKKRETKQSQILNLINKSGVVRAAEIRSRGIHHEYLRLMCLQGELIRVGRGLYSLPDADITSHHGLVQAAMAIPKGVVCLLSALRYHEIGTQAPHEVWMALDRRAAQPQCRYPKTRIVRFSGEALTHGVLEQTIESIKVRIYSLAKTVADCFKYRNKIGLDIALEALRETLDGRKCTTDELWKSAKVCRVTNVMRPYMEAIL